MNAILQAHYEKTNPLNISVTFPNNGSISKPTLIVQNCYRFFTDSETSAIFDTFNVNDSNDTSNTGSKADFIYTVQRINDTLKNTYPEITTFKMNDVNVKTDSALIALAQNAWTRLKNILIDPSSTMVNKNNFEFISINCKLHD